MDLYSFLFNYLLSRLDAEMTHRMALGFLRIAIKAPTYRSLLSSIYSINDERLAVNALGLRFPNPIGLAGGFDKNAEVILAASSLGFGFIEVGTVTPDPQEGNPKPRLFRLKEERTLINRTGFLNAGCDEVWHNIKKANRSSSTIIVMSLGKGDFLLLF